jgi:hypothetical protein
MVVDHQERRCEQIGPQFLLARLVDTQGGEVLAGARLREPQQRPA